MFRNANHSTKTSRNSGSKVEWNGNSWQEILENLGILQEVVLFSENNTGNAVPFPTGIVPELKPKFLAEWNAPKV